MDLKSRKTHSPIAIHDRKARQTSFYWGTDHPVAPQPEAGRAEPVHPAWRRHKRSDLQLAVPLLGLPSDPKALFCLGFAAVVVAKFTRKGFYSRKQRRGNWGTSCSISMAWLELYPHTAVTLQRPRAEKMGEKTSRDQQKLLEATRCNWERAIAFEAH